MRKNRGITLIALIITIIILLILVGVSINLAIKGDLFGSAEKAVSGTNDKVALEQTRVDELMGELDEIEKEYCSHIWKDGEIITNATCTTAGKKQNVCENCKKVIEVEVPALGHNYENSVCTRCGIAEVKKKITFTIDGIGTYEVDEGTTWYDVINSELNNTWAEVSRTYK